MNLEIPLSREVAASNLNYLLSDEASETDIYNYLCKRPVEKAKVEELLGYYDVVWSKRKKANFPRSDVDIVGTGGVQKPRYNVSTTVAFILASLGIKVSKHGNKGSRKPNGSFNFLESLGFDLDDFTRNAVVNLERYGLTFLFARDWHPCFKAFAPVRAKIQNQTVLNLMGPLLNPVEPKSYFIGCNNVEIAEILAEVLKGLGKKGTILSGKDGLDEITLSDETVLFKVSENNISEETVDPKSFGYEVLDEKELYGGSGAENAKEFLELIQGGGSSSIKQLVVANASFVLNDARKLNNLIESVNLVEGALKSGKVYRFYRTFLGDQKA